MKWKLPIGVCVLISLALVVFGLVFGTVSGFADERRQVTALLEGENGLMDVLSYRGADGLNLCVVARRHLPQADADVTALEAAAKALRAAGGRLSDKKAQDARMEEAVSAVSAKLTETASFQQSERDRRYLDMLVSDLQSLRASAVVTTYNQAARDFNSQLSSPVSGVLASLLGVEPCALYE